MMKNECRVCLTILVACLSTGARAQTGVPHPERDRMLASLRAAAQTDLPAQVSAAENALADAGGDAVGPKIVTPFGVRSGSLFASCESKGRVLVTYSNLVFDAPTGDSAHAAEGLAMLTLGRKDCDIRATATMHFRVAEGAAGAAPVTTIRDYAIKQVAAESVAIPPVPLAKPVNEPGHAL